MERDLWGAVRVGCAWWWSGGAGVVVRRRASRALSHVATDLQSRHRVFVRLQLASAGLGAQGDVAGEAHRPAYQGDLQDERLGDVLHGLRYETREREDVEEGCLRPRGAIASF